MLSCSTPKRRSHVSRVSQASRSHQSQPTARRGFPATGLRPHAPAGLHPCSASRHECSCAEGVRAAWRLRACTAAHPSWVFWRWRWRQICLSWYRESSSTNVTCLRFQPISGHPKSAEIGLDGLKSAWIFQTSRSAAGLSGSRQNQRAAQWRAHAQARLIARGGLLDQVCIQQPLTQHVRLLQRVVTGSKVLRTLAVPPSRASRQTNPAGATSSPYGRAPAIST